MRFGNPSLLWALLLVPVLGLWLAAGLARRRRALSAFADEPILSRLVQAARFEKLVIKSIALVVAAAFILAAAARPQWGSTLEQVARKGVDVLVAIDISESMMAEDLKPSRLGKAREEASRLLDRLKGDRVGLLAFAGSGGVLCPLTLDYNAVRIFLDSLTPDMISYPGTSLGEAMKTALRTFGSEERKFKVVVLFSDGEEQVDPQEVERVAGEAAASGLVIHTIGTGTPSGDPIPVRDRDARIVEYKKDASGRVVTTRLDETLLARIAQITGGSYYPATAAESEMDRVAEAISGMDKKEMQAKLMTQYEERYQVPLAIGVAALLAESLLSARRRVRRGVKSGARARAASLVIAATAMVSAASAASASGVAANPLWAEAPAGLVAEGNRLYQEGHLAEALEAYRRAQQLAPDSQAVHYNIGNALFKQGEYERAYDEYRQAFSAKERELAEWSRYNAGNAHFSRKNWPEAIRNYQEALRMNAADKDAKTNLELALRNMQQEKQKQQQEQDQNQQQDEKQDQNDQQKQQQEQQQNQQPKDAGRPEESPRDQKPAAGEKEKLSREEAARILDAMKEQDRPPKDHLKVPPPDKRPERDW
jgi:Ca-activated chloride channel family protein